MSDIISNAWDFFFFFYTTKVDQRVELYNSQSDSGNSEINYHCYPLLCEIIAIIILAFSQVLMGFSIFGVQVLCT